MKKRKSTLWSTASTSSSRSSYSRETLHSSLVEQSSFNVQTIQSPYSINCLQIIEVSKPTRQAFFVCSSSCSNCKETLKFYDVSSMECLFEVPKQGIASVIAMSFCEISLSFVTATLGRTISEYKFNPNRRLMKLRSSFTFRSQIEQLVCHRHMLFIVHSKAQMITWYDMNRKRAVKTFTSEEAITEITYIPESKSIAWNQNTSSFLRLYDSKVIDIYLQPNKNNEDNYRSIPNQFFINQGVGTDRKIEQVCRKAIYERQLRCVIFIFIDFLLFVDPCTAQPLFIIKDLPNIVNVKHNSAHDNLLIQCDKKEGECQSTILLIYQRNYRKNSRKASSQTSLRVQDQLQFKKLGIHKIPASRFLCSFEDYLLMDSEENEGVVLRLKLAQKEKKKVSFLSSQIGSSKMIGSSISEIEQQIDEEQEIIDEEKYQQLINEDFKPQIQEENQEKTCWCTIY